MKKFSRATRLSSGFVIFVIAPMLISVASLGWGQSSVGPPPSASETGTNVDVCNLWEADFANSVEETVCITGDASELTVYAEVDQDLTWYEGYPDWSGEDPAVAGLGAEGVLFDNGGEVLDTSMVEGSVDGGSPPSISTWNNTSSYQITSVNLYDTYSLEGYYSECIDPTDSGSSDCVWSGANDSGISVQAEID